MAAFSAIGLLLAILVIVRHRTGRGTVSDSAAAAAAHLHTLPTTAAQPAVVGGGSDDRATGGAS
jgi:hypothetical protein